jgi:hypothetical protein
MRLADIEEKMRDLRGVFGDMSVDSCHGHIFEKKIIYTIVTKNEKIK